MMLIVDFTRNTSRNLGDFGSIQVSFGDLRDIYQYSSEKTVAGLLLLLNSLLQRHAQTWKGYADSDEVRSWIYSKNSQNYSDGPLVHFLGRIAASTYTFSVRDWAGIETPKSCPFLIVPELGEWWVWHRR